MMSGKRLVPSVFIAGCLLGAVYWKVLWPESFVLPTHKSYTFPYHPAIRPGSVGIFVINLDHSVDRWKSIRAHLLAFPFSVARVSGIYGKKMPALRQDSAVVDLEKYRMYLKGKEPGLGEIGCYLSHHKALGEFLRSDCEYGIIVEDDVSFSPDFPQVVQGLVRRSLLWDVCALELHPLQSGWPLPVTSLFSNRKLCIYLKEAWRAGAYLVNRWAAERLVEKALPMCLPWDIYYMRFWEFHHVAGDQDQRKRSLKFLGVEPRCAFQTFGDSEIEAAGPRQEERPKARERYLWSGRWFAWCSHITRAVYASAQWVSLWIDAQFLDTKE